MLRCNRAALASGDLVALGARELSTFTIAGEEYRLRLLDKRRDLLTYLRFADVAVDTCYRSDANDHAGKRQRTIEIWKDPLWFCLRIERSARGGFRPIGFTFGDFVDLEGRIGIVLSGLYMRPNVPAARLAIVRAIEHGLCAPLGIDDIGISSAYASRGVFPPEYVEHEHVTLTRLRALRRDGRLITWAYDYVSRVTNEPVDVRYLHWRCQRDASRRTQHHARTFVLRDRGGELLNGHFRHHRDSGCPVADSCTPMAPASVQPSGALAALAAR